MFQRRWEPDDLAERAGFDDVQILEILSARIDVTPATVNPLASAFDVDSTALLQPLFSSVAISPDGRQALATNAEDNTVSVWDLPQDTEPGQTELGPARLWLDLKAQGGSAWSAVFSPDGQQVLTVGGNDARLWDVQAAHELKTFSPHGPVASADFSPDGQWIVTGSWDGSAKIWDATTGRAVRKLAGEHRGPIHCAVFSPRDGNQVLTAGDDGTAKLWDASTGKVLRTFAGHQGRVRRAAFSADGQQLVTTADDGTARVWDPETAESFALEGHRGAVLCAAFSIDGSQLITGGEDNTARLWDLETREQRLGPLRGHTASVTSVAFSPDARRVLTGGQDDTAKLWDAERGSEILSLDGHSRDVTSVSFSPDGRYVLTGSRDGTAVLWLADDWRDGRRTGE
jgi:WD40 repeat protein